MNKKVAGAAYGYAISAPIAGAKQNICACRLSISNAGEKTQLVSARLDRRRTRQAELYRESTPAASKAPEAYHFDKRGVGSGQEWTKALLKPELNRKAA
jgi:hypothetical protein